VGVVSVSGVVDGIGGAVGSGTGVRVRVGVGGMGVGTSGDEVGVNTAAAVIDGAGSDAVETGWQADKAIRRIRLNSKLMWLQGRRLCGFI